MKTLVTGGAGFIGSHLCDLLVDSGNEVVVLDNLSTGSRNNICHLENRIKLIVGDIRDNKLVESLIEESDLVLHMAAAVGVQNILVDPLGSISTNYYGSEVILKATSKYKKRIFIASTSEIYGKNPKQPLSETDDRIIGTPQKLRWTYSDAKALEEATAYSLFLSEKLKVTTIRFFNTVGPRQSSKYGMVLPRFIEAARTNKPLKIFGDGTQKRVFCHVKDATNALLKLYSNDHSIGQTFNVGGISEISITELANLVIRLTNSGSKVEYINYSEAYPVGYEDMQRRVPDISKIRNLTGWNPKISLVDIIQDIISY